MTDANSTKNDKPQEIEQFPEIDNNEKNDAVADQDYLEVLDADSTEEDDDELESDMEDGWLSE